VPRAVQLEFFGDAPLGATAFEMIAR